MHYEFEDYRQKNIKDPGPWLTWTVPSELAVKYLFRLLLWMFLIPWLLFGTYRNIVAVSSCGLFFLVKV